MLIADRLDFSKSWVVKPVDKPVDVLHQTSPARFVGKIPKSQFYSLAVLPCRFHSLNMTKTDLAVLKNVKRHVNQHVLSKLFDLFESCAMQFMM